ncbi:Altered inheritance of mitochondria protein 9, mitochondrial [Mycena sanguinolenta]|uniref:Altered inheritance of mitochondria protein 9, mitochondrial n=1 Tax=Mycena sanguinolenta TaxID=230812 RepID=A0A8H6ZCA5_9AGAR|nr:Altered inheritance of mitochondria protein 9, mitochondrial [Mycena sanguinolenta]
MQDSFTDTEFVAHKPTSAEQASQKFLLDWDRNLCGEVQQLEMTLMGHAPDIRRFVASLNLPQLQARATKAMNKKCVGVYLLAVGGYNIVYRLPFDGQTDIVARLRIPGGGFMDNTIDMTPQDRSARFVSEVATMRFVKARTSIPVPELYYWDSVPGNPVGAPYMLMERISGVPPWPHPRTGNAYRWIDEAGYPDSQFRGRGTVGPLLPPYGLIVNDTGPFESSRQFLLACVSRELDRIRATEKWTAQRTKFTGCNGGVDALLANYAERWFKLLHQAIATLPDELSSCPDVFRVAHTDFQSSNLLVSSAEDPTIVAVLDWEGARVLPAWDPRSGCTISWLLSGVDEDVEDHLSELYFDITTKDGRALGQSLMCWEWLTWFFESSPSLTMDRDTLNERFQTWFSEAEEAGKESCRFELEAFRPLMTFIANDCL